MRIGSDINTFTGVEFYLLDPRTEDIGHALTFICRGNGHYIHFYSLAQHSLNCAKEAENQVYPIRIRLGCLLHDASEAYISDITRPVKKELTSYLEIETKLQKFIYQAYRLSDITLNEIQLIKEIDDAMLCYEMKVLLDTHMESRTKLTGQYNLYFKAMHEVKRELIECMEGLCQSLSSN